MGSLGQSVLRLVIAAMVCGIVLSMVRNGASEGLLRFLCGTFLTITLFAPLNNGCFLPQLTFFEDALADAEAKAEAGSEMAEEEIRHRISEALEAYILDKAGQWEAELNVAITFGEDSIPVGAELSGKIPESVQKDISRILTEDLGIPKENQLWIG